MRKLNESNEGVSPVIGVILMVAITVVLATLVFLLVANTAKAPQGVPRDVGFLIDNDHNITISSVHESMQYSQLTVKDNGVAIDYLVNGDLPDGILNAGDVIGLGSLAGGSHKVSLVFDGTIIYAASFLV